jgi:Flp pilus assembly protein TadD
VSAETLHALGVAHVIEGREDEAVQTLERAVAANSKNARIWSDLAAAYLVNVARRGKDTSPDTMSRVPPTQNETPHDAKVALLAAEHAITLDPSLPEAWFNLALAREAAGQRDRAAEAWRHAADLDRDPAWRAEAASRASHK